MALTATTLAGAKATGDPFIRLTSGTGIAKKMLALVDSEWMRVTDASLSPTVSVIPGWNGSTAGPHGVLAPVLYGVASDFVAGPGGPDSTSYGADGAITVPLVDTVIYLTKATAGAYTIVAPNLGQQNTITFVSTTAAAHTVTFTPGFYGNTTTSDVATFPATANATFTVKANNGIWAPIATAASGVTFG